MGSPTNLPKNTTWVTSKLNISSKGIMTALDRFPPQKTSVELERNIKHVHLGHRKAPAGRQPREGRSRAGLPASGTLASRWPCCLALLLPPRGQAQRVSALRSEVVNLIQAGRQSSWTSKGDTVKCLCPGMCSSDHTQPKHQAAEPSLRRTSEPRPAQIADGLLSYTGTRGPPGRPTTQSTTEELSRDITGSMLQGDAVSPGGDCHPQRSRPESQSLHDGIKLEL